MKILRNISIFLFSCCALLGWSQNSMVGDGFGGRKWYKPTNYTVGSYSAFSLCYSNPCDTSTNQLMGWGSNGHEELGQIGISGSNTPIPIPGMTNVCYYSTGYNMGAIQNNGDGWVWGNGLFATPTQVISNAKFLDGSIGYVSFVKNNGTVWCIGDNTSGNFGDGTTNSSYSSCVQMSNISTAVRTANGYETTYILLSNGKVMSCGANNFCMLGNGSSLANQLFPDTIPALSNIVDVKAHYMATAALDSAGNVFVWGNSGYIGDSSYLSSTTPKQIALNNIVAISACCDGFHFFALDENKNCYAWGSASGSGSGSGFDLSPVLVATDVIDIMAGETFSYIVKSDGSLWATGQSSTSSGSIWLNLPDIPSIQFLQLNPSQVPGACNIVSSSLLIANACGGEEGSITVNYTGGALPYSYDIGNGPQLTNVFSGLSSGTYTISISDSNDCVTNIVATIDSVTFANPVVTTADSIIVCQNSNVSLTAAGAATYFWSGPSGFSSSGSSIIVSPTSNTDYTVTGIDSHGCVDTAISNITLVPLPLLSGISSICSGESTVLTATGEGTFNWSPSVSLNASVGQSVIANPTSTTTYTVQNSVSGCLFTETFVVNILPSPVATTDAQSPFSVPLNTLITLTSQSINASQILWTDCLGDTSSQNSIQFTFESPGSCCITLTATNGNCTDTVEHCYLFYEEQYISIPNIFSPDGDGINETFFVTTEGIQQLHCEIYDRWGLKLYEWDGVNGFWNGKTKQGNAPEGTYYYLINYKGGDQQQYSKQGFFMLVERK